MTAEEVLNLFIETSGRYDLLEVVPGEEEGDPDIEQPSARAYHYLRSGQRWLDRELGHPKTDAWIVIELAAEETVITFENVRYVKDVFEVVTDGDPKRIAWTRAYYDVETEEDHWPLHGIEVEPVDYTRTLKILCAWYSPAMSDGDAVSFWTIQHPEVLIRAMQRELEVDMRNTQGVKDYEEPLMHDCQRIYADMVAEEMSGPSSYWHMD